MVSKSNDQTIDYEKLKKEVFIENNNLRKNPSSFIPALQEHLKLFKGKVYTKPGEIGIVTQEGTKAVEEAIAFLKKQKPITGLEYSDLLGKAAQDHANDIGPKGSTSHDGSDGSKSSTRIERYLQWDLTCAENIDFGGYTGKDVVLSLLIDDGVSSRGHRKNMLNTEVKFLGVGAGPHKQYGTCIVLDYVGGIKEKGKDNSKSSDSKPNTVKVQQPKIKNIEGDKVKELNKKFDKNVNIVCDENPFKNDPDAPKDAISCDTNVQTKIEGKKKTVTTTKIYKTMKGETITKTKVESSNC